MIGLIHWIAAIGLWNHCKIRLAPIASFIFASARDFITSQVQDDSLSKRSFVTVSGVTICRLVIL